jgi:peroxiredoxin Q/BCP
MIAVGQRAPDFSGMTGSGKQLSLKDFRGKQHVILYFFPKDFTPGCTKEACSFRDRRSEIAKLDAEIIGASFDTAEKHKQFADAYQLPYPLLSDPDGAIAQAYGVGRLGGFLGGFLPTKRVTFVIDKDGIVQHVIKSELNIDKHIDEAIGVLKRLQSK